MSRDVTHLPPSTTDPETASTNVGDGDGSSGASTSKLEDRQRPSQSTLAGPSLPEGCAYGTLAKVDGDGKEAETVIWVEFAPGSRDNPFFFSKWRKVSITACATFFTFMTAYTTTAYSISEESMCRDLGCNNLQFASGIALYAWGFGIAPLMLAPLSEEFGRRWTYATACFLFFILHLMMSLAKNMATVLIARFIIGCAGSVGATLVGGTISDIFIPAHRGLPMAMFGFCAVFGTGFGAVTMAWVEVEQHLGWRWIQWIQFIILGAFFPVCLVVMRETRATVILRRRAAKLRKERGLSDGGRYLARAEIDKVKFVTAMGQSMTRPLVFLATEPIVTFFSLWIALGWGVFYTQIAGIPYTYRKLHGFSTTQVGLVYLCICIGAIIGFAGNFIQEAIYRKRAAKRGVEARLYAPMVCGVLFAVGCYINGFTSIPSVHWIAPCIGLTCVLAAILIIYITSFTYLSECYGVYASSAIAGQSFARNVMGGAFSFLTAPMFNRLTVRWSLVMMGGFATLLAAVPFVAFVWGPQIRARSRYSKMLMAQEREQLDKERRARVSRGLDVHDAEDLEGDANERGEHELDEGQANALHLVPSVAEKIV
ncbi:Efflux pump atB [Vanrija pseudolonga]|uniref:Efflux pump atB n=1 Tax=Vanrija pseudolonga TaxID=143232 RepID=A0AAF1BL97_9TREE|nr:Efflux pump atB [Vanrija pseudolonga]